MAILPSTGSWLRDAVIVGKGTLATIEQRIPGYVAYDWFRQALDLSAQAAPLNLEGNDDGIVCWNTCVRMIQSNPPIQRRTDDDDFQYLE